MSSSQGGHQEHGTTKSRPGVRIVFAHRRQVQNPTHLVTEGVDGDAKSTCQTKVTNLELAFTVDEQVLRLEIAVKDTVVVAKFDTLGLSRVRGKCRD